MKKWFKDKDYGWGWAPASWEGWLVTLFFVMLFVVRSISFALIPEPSSLNALTYAVDVLGLAVLLLIVAFITGEKPHWKWGGKLVKASFAIEQTILLITFLSVTFFAGFIGSQFTTVGSWYYSLVKPSLNPPSWVFAPVWSLLYLLMGLGAYFAWYHLKKHRTAILVLYGINLVLNTLWSYAFFGLHDVTKALIVIIALDIVVLILTLRFIKWHAVAGYLFLPYLGWIIFATYLNLNILLLN